MSVCKHYDKELDCCKKLSDWSNPMPVLQPCVKGPCEHFEEPTNNIINNFKNALLKKIFPYDTADKKQYSINAYAVERAIIEVAEELSKECPDCKHFVGCEEAVWSGRCDQYEEKHTEDTK